MNPKMQNFQLMEAGELLKLQLMENSDYIVDV